MILVADDRAGLKTLTAPAYATRYFDIIVDWTSFSTSSQVPFQWLKYCIEMFPLDVRQRFLTTYLLNPNAAAHKYLRRLYNITAGTVKSLIVLASRLAYASLQV